MDNQLKSAYRLRKHRLLFLFTFIAIITYIVWRTFFTLPTKYGVVSLLCGVLLLAAEVSSAFEAIVNYAMLSQYAPPELPDLPEEWYPEVDIFVILHRACKIGARRRAALCKKA